MKREHQTWKRKRESIYDKNDGRHLTCFGESKRRWNHKEKTVRGRW